MVKLAVILAGLIAVATAAHVFETVDRTFLQQWETYKTKYGKHYRSEEEEKLRMKIFMEKLLTIERHNKLYARGEVGYTLGVNQFSDMLKYEVTHSVCGLKINSTRNIPTPKSSLFIPTSSEDVPDKIDWRDKGAVTPVKNQRECGSCYAFSTTGTLEGQQFLKSGKLVSLSEQNIVDCSLDYGNEGCRGGWMDWSYKYIIHNKGLDTEDAYPYTAQESISCRYDSRYVGVTVSDYKIITEGDENALKIAVAKKGPIAVAIDTHGNFDDYESGVYYSKECESKKTDLNHAVLIVGYGSTDNGTDYWIVKNSWGAKWGDKGYILMSRNRDNNCGIATYASYPIV